MTNAEAIEIVKKCTAHVFYREGIIDDPPPSLAEHSLSELLEANDRVKALNGERKGHAQVVCDDRLVAALYVLYGYEPTPQLTDAATHLFSDLELSDPDYAVVRELRHRLLDLRKELP